MEYLFTSDRLGFRGWKKSDKTPFAKMNADTEVMRYFPSVLTAVASDELVDRLQKHYHTHGFTFFAVDELETKKFIGFIGLIHTSFEAYFTPCIEIGWRLKKEDWYRGFATEGAKRCLEFAFAKLQVDKIYAITTLTNKPSIHVMQKIGMQRQGTFEHPKIADNHPFKTELLYRITSDAFTRA